MKRVLIKVSGEALSSANQPVCFEKVEETAREIKLLFDAGLEIGIVVGGGNIVRGRDTVMQHGQHGHALYRDQHARAAGLP